MIWSLWRIALKKLVRMINNMLAGAGEFWSIVCVATNVFAFIRRENNKNRAGTDLIAITLYKFLWSALVRVVLNSLLLSVFMMILINLCRLSLHHQFGFKLYILIIIISPSYKQFLELFLLTEQDYFELYDLQCCQYFFLFMIIDEYIVTTFSV